MKQALVLGLALAANAMTADQTDNELIVATSGGKFESLSKFTTRISKVMFDEQADDELLIRPIIKADDDEFIAMLLPRGHFKTEEEYQKYVARMRFSRDDAADDELLAMIRPDANGATRGYYPYYDQAIKKFKILKEDDELFVAPQGKLADLAKKYPGMIMFDEVADDELRVRPLAAADDELFVAPQGKLADLAKKYPGMIMFDEVADDELIAMILPREHFKTEEEYKRYLAMIPRGSRDDAADDELRLIDNLPRDQYGNAVRPPYARFDEVADDELLIRPIVKADDDEFIAMLLPRDHFKTEEEYQKYVARMRFSRDDAADDELIAMILPREHFKTEEEYKRYLAMIPKGSRDDAADDELHLIDNLPRDQYGNVVRPPYARFDEVADDELALMLRPRKDFKTEEEYQKYYTRARYTLDDAADDELVNLGDLIRFAKNEKFAAAHTMDELRAEKPSHVKAEEMKQLKSELPKMKRKLRPADETAFLA